MTERNILDKLETALSDMVQDAFYKFNAMSDDDPDRDEHYLYFQALVASRKTIRRVLSEVLLGK